MEQDTGAGHCGTRHRNGALWNKTQELGAAELAISLHAKKYFNQGLMSTYRNVSFGINYLVSSYRNVSFGIKV